MTHTKKKSWKLRIMKGTSLVLFGTSINFFLLPNILRSLSSFPVFNFNSETLTALAQKVFSVQDLFYPSLWMGDVEDIEMNDDYTESLCSIRPDGVCIRIQYSAERSQNKKWAGIIWGYPDINPEIESLTDDSRARDLTGATKLTFFASGEQGAEKAEFKVGGIIGVVDDSIQPEAFKVTTSDGGKYAGPVTLTNQWQKYEIDLSDKDLTGVKAGFIWVTNTRQNPAGATIYLDDIQYE